MCSLLSNFPGKSGGIAIVYGGLATELERHSANLNDPLWSAKCLLTAPHLIRQTTSADRKNEKFQKNVTKRGFVPETLLRRVPTILLGLFCWGSLFLLSLAHVELRRAYNCEIMLTKVKIPLPNLMIRPAKVGIVAE